MQSASTWIPLDRLVVGETYRLDARRQKFGVWTGHSFLGVQWEFGQPCLSSEAHWDQGGSAKPLEATGPLPQEVELSVGWDTCEICGQRVQRVKPSERLYQHAGGDDEHRVELGAWHENERLFDMLFALEPREAE